MRCSKGWSVASLTQDSVSGRFYIRFRYAGESYKRSLSTKDRFEANVMLSRVKDTLKDIKRGRRFSLLVRRREVLLLAAFLASFRSVRSRIRIRRDQLWHPRQPVGRCTLGVTQSLTGCVRCVQPPFSTKRCQIAIQQWFLIPYIGHASSWGALTLPYRTIRPPGAQHAIQPLVMSPPTDPSIRLN